VALYWDYFKELNRYQKPNNGKQFG
jgi:hypothetical protein